MMKRRERKEFAPRKVDHAASLEDIARDREERAKAKDADKKDK